MISVSSLLLPLLCQSVRLGLEEKVRLGKTTAYRCHRRRFHTAQWETPKLGDAFCQEFFVNHKVLWW